MNIRQKYMNEIWQRKMDYTENIKREKKNSGRN